MPEYHIPVSAPVAGIGFFELDAFTRGYIEAMFFTNCSDPDDGDLQDATFDELDPKSLAKAIADCEAFQRDNSALLSAAVGHNGYDLERAGNDFWYSRNGHGLGFWDRQLGVIGDLLHDACKHREVDVYRGDDGKVYLS